MLRLVGKKKGKQRRRLVPVKPEDARKDVFEGLQGEAITSEHSLLTLMLPPNYSSKCSRKRIKQNPLESTKLE